MTAQCKSESSRGRNDSSGRRCRAQRGPMSSEVQCRGFKRPTRREESGHVACSKSLSLAVPTRTRIHSPGQRTRRWGQHSFRLVAHASLGTVRMAEASSSSCQLPATPRTPTGNAVTTVQHRLLYRGALSLSDSYMLLDGLSFVAETRCNSQDSPAVNLLTNPLALALESMRGRPSLYLRGTEKVKEVWLDMKSIINVLVSSTLQNLTDLICSCPSDTFIHTQL